jgi:hypothetical protein
MQSNGCVYCCVALRFTYRGEKRFIQETGGKKSLGSPWRRWENTIKIDLTGMGCGDVEWTYMAQDRDKWPVVVNMVINLRVP